MTSPVAMELRTVREEDRSFLVALYGSSRADEMASWGWSDEQRDMFVAMQFSARRCQYDTVYPDRDDYIINLQGKAAGLLSVSRGETALSLVDIALLPELHGRGVGTKLVQGLQQEAQGSGKPLRLHVLAENGAAVRFYHRLGFMCIEEGVYRLLEWRPDTA